MATAFDGPTPGNRASTAAGAVFRLTTPSTPLPARAPAGRASRTRQSRAAARRTLALSARAESRLLGRLRAARRRAWFALLTVALRRRPPKGRARKTRSAGRGWPRAPRSLRFRWAGRHSYCDSRRCSSRPWRNSGPRSRAARRAPIPGRFVGCAVVGRSVRADHLRRRPRRRVLRKYPWAHRQAGVGRGARVGAGVGRREANAVLAVRVAGLGQVLHREVADAGRLAGAGRLVTAQDRAVTARLRQIADAGPVRVAVGGDLAVVADLLAAAGAQQRRHERGGHQGHVPGHLHGPPFTVNIRPVPGGRHPRRGWGGQSG